MLLAKILYEKLIEIVTSLYLHLSLKGKLFYFEANCIFFFVKKYSINIIHTHSLVNENEAIEVLLKIMTDNRQIHSLSDQQRNQTTKSNNANK